MIISLINIHLLIFYLIATKVDIALTFIIFLSITSITSVPELYLFSNALQGFAFSTSTLISSFLLFLFQSILFTLSLALYEFSMPPLVLKNS